MLPFNKFIFQGAYGFLPLSETVGSTNGGVSQKFIQFSCFIHRSQLYESIMNWLNLHLFITIHSFTTIKLNIVQLSSTLGIWAFSNWFKSEFTQGGLQRSLCSFQETLIHTKTLTDLKQKNLNHTHNSVDTQKTESFTNKSHFHLSVRLVSFCQYKFPNFFTVIVGLK